MRVKIPGMRVLFRLGCVAAVSFATATATLPSASQTPPGPERGCCLFMVHNANNCPPPSQPTPGMNGSCCNMALCLHLFLQTGDVRLEPGYAEIEWASFAATKVSRAERPPVPPPRA